VANQSQGEQPMAQALVICDSIIDDIGTRKKSLIGIFSVINAAVFPVQHPSMTVYASLTNGRGEVPVVLRCVRVEDDHEVLSLAGAVRFPDPNQVIDLVFNLKGVPFERPGLYTFELLSNEIPLLEKRFNVLELPAGPLPPK
jgi:hypothetical protein